MARPDRRSTEAASSPKPTASSAATHDTVGTFLTTLSNGNYVVSSINWHGNRGAATWGDGTTGVSGVVSEANSLVGSNPGDLVGSNAELLSNGSFVVGSRFWNGNRGAATWGSGTSGVQGVVSEANSLVGSNPDDQVGYDVSSTSNGNYLVFSPHWNDDRGAVTWISDPTGFRGTADADNSLVGSSPGDRVGGGNPSNYFTILLNNGNYVVISPNWNGNRGAVTWGDGSTGVRGVVSEANSLVGSDPGDLVGSNNPAVLSNGNYL